jgi:hypothetical protein
MVTVAVDFDGTLHPYTDGWQGTQVADEPPIEGAYDFLLMLTSRGFDVVVHSGRANTIDGARSIHEWLRRHGMRDMVREVTAEKPMAIAYVDDRAVHFAGDYIDALEKVEAMHREMLEKHR